MAKIRETEELTQEQKKAILDARAALLADQSKSQKKENQLDILEFVISGERFALEARFVREASKAMILTPLPCTPDFVLGLINFRGQIIPLLDLRNLLELKKKDESREQQIVVVQTTAAKAGIAVDEISGIAGIPEADLKSAKDLVSKELFPLLKGMSTERLALLDLEKILSDPRLIVDMSPEGARVLD
ncbi:MAG: chemotaxis protein CheW [Candidatus Obscuribacterales bacterium]|nr:chemotaxis protein CheW [Candidatus Obscuribacterales bacterium]